MEPNNNPSENNNPNQPAVEPPQGEGNFQPQVPPVNSAPLTPNQQTPGTPGPDNYPPNQPQTPVATDQLNTAPTVQPPVTAPNAETPPEAIVPPAKKSKLILIIIAAVVALLLVLGGVVAFAAMGKKSSSNSNANSSNQPESPPASKEVTANTMSDYSIVCKGGKITNVNTTSTTKHFVFFTKNKTPGAEYSEDFISLSNKDARAISPTDVQRVGCFASTSKTKEPEPCKLTTSDKKEVNVTAYSATYQMEIRDPSTGKVLGTETVPGPFTRCPTSLFVSDTNPEYVAPPDDGSVDAAIQKYL